MRLQTEDLVSVLEMVTYRPGWSFEALERPEGPMVRITARVENSYQPGSEVDLGIASYPPPMALESQKAFLEWLMWRLERVELHECHEWFKVAGVLYQDPHAEERVRVG